MLPFPHTNSWPEKTPSDLENKIMNPIDYRPQSIEDLIGDAQRMAKTMRAVIARSKADGTPIKVFLQGEPGIGKSACLDLFCREIGADKWSVTKFNGTQLKIDAIEDYARGLHFKDIFGGYRVLRIEEVDRCNQIVQARMLTLLDDLPSHTAVICTSNLKLSEMEPRFQSRFQVFELKGPSADEIERLLRDRFSVAMLTARRIATFACGNVRQALMDAQSECDQALSLEAA
jgi:replication-associated recombination protein RarA